MDPLVIDVGGSNLEMGRQHARGALHLRSDVAAWVEAAVERHPNDEPSTADRLDEVVDAWERLTPGTLDQITGMAEVYELPTRGMLTAVLATYLDSARRNPGPPDGCTAFAVSGAHPVLVKNRDNDRRFLGMQTVVRANPDEGHSWLALSTAGAPGVHSSGMNTEGLCVADTHVSSTDVGPGVPRFSAMMHLLEQCTTTDEALDYLVATPQMGLGTLTLLDAGGLVAVVECAYSGSVVLPTGTTHEARTGDAVFATNHFVSPDLSDSLFEPESGTPGANSRARWGVVRDALAGWAASPRQGTSAVRELAGSHLAGDGDLGTVQGSVCQHGRGLKAETISTVIYDPLQRRLDLCLGSPCSESFTPVTFTQPPRR